jgi:hypothetical protein
MNPFESDEQDVLRTKTKEKRDLWTFVAAVNHEPGKGWWQFASAA